METLGSAAAAGSTASRVEPDEAAFRAFYARTARPLWAYLVRSAGDRAAADDLLQESYLRLLGSGLETADEDHRKNYLFRIATNLVRDGFRHARRVREVPVEEAPTGDRGQGAAVRGLRSDLRGALTTLRARDRQLLWLAHVEEMSHREIAGVLGVKTESVRPMVFRARQRLATALKQRGFVAEETP